MNCKKYYKVFVGNVPYDCSNKDFSKCFENIDGFIKAETIKDHDSKLSRGFGFVSLKTKDDADNLLNSNILFKNRLLRFTLYHSNTSKIDNTTDDNYIIIKNIPENIMKLKMNEIKKIFSNNKPIGKCFFITNHNTGIMKNELFMEIINDSKFKDIIKNNEIKTNDGKITLHVERYKMKFYVKKNKDIENYSAYNNSNTKY